MSKIVEFFTPEGEVTQYRPLSARLPTFLAVYGPERGFSVDTEIVDSLSLKPGLLKLYEIVLHAGRKPEEAGLPPLNGTGQTLVGRATLRDREGRVLATATAAKPIQSYKDLEVLETAARQRLLAALGFGGEVLDTDETRDQTDQGWVSRPIVPAVPATRAVGATPIVPPPSIQDTAGTPASIQDAAEAPASSQDAPVAEVAEGVMPLAVAAGIPPVASPPAAPAPVAAPPVSDRDARALTALIRQIEQQARVRGIEPPVVTTRQEAQVALQRLLRHV